MRNDDLDDEPMELVSEPDEEDREHEAPEPVDAPPVKRELPPIKLPEISAKSADKWKPRSRGCLVTGLAVGLLVLTGVFLIAYSSLKQSVWVSFEKSCERATSALPFEMTKERRQRFKDDVAAFAKKVHTLEDPYPAMGRFTGAVSSGFRDGRFSLRDVEEVEAIIESMLHTPSPTEP